MNVNDKFERENMAKAIALALVEANAIHSDRISFLHDALSIIDTTLKNYDPNIPIDHDPWKIPK